MARKLYYKILDDGRSDITDNQWLEISRIQHWYNSEFVWTAGKLALKMYLVFVNPEHQYLHHRGLEETIQRVTNEYRQRGLSENDIILQLEKDKLIIVKRGGYFDGCVASGYTRVAGNEFNAFLVCDFLLKISIIIPDKIISLFDEGGFIKTGNVNLQAGEVHIQMSESSKASFYQNIVDHRHVFSVVDAAKYDTYPQYNSIVPDVNNLTFEQRKSILQEWNWLGFESNYDVNGDDIQGYNLNDKVKSFKLKPD